MFRRLFYVSLRQQLPRLRHHLTNGRELDTRDEESHILLEAGLVRDWTGGKHLMKSRRLSAQQLFWLLSERRRADWRRRLRNRIIVLFGGYPSDPHRPELRDMLWKAKQQRKDK